MPREGSTSRESFYRTLTAAIADFADNGFDSLAQLGYWLGRIRKAAADSLVSEAMLEAELRKALQAVYMREVDRGLILKRHLGVARFQLERVKPRLRGELDRRIMASASLIKLNRQQAVETTIRRFSGWATSIPAGGSEAVKKGETKAEIRKALAQLPYEERRVAIDQGQKFNAALNNILATDNGALAFRWHSKWRQSGYHYRPDHKERDEHIYTIRGSWALDQGLIKVGEAGYSDQITAPAEEVFCGCKAQYLYHLRDLPPGMLTEKGRGALAQAKASIAA